MRKLFIFAVLKNTYYSNINKTSKKLMLPTKRSSVTKANLQHLIHGKSQIKSLKPNLPLFGKRHYSDGDCAILISALMPS